MSFSKKAAAVALAALLPLSAQTFAGHCGGDHSHDGAKAEQSMAKQTIADVAAGNDDFSTLVAAVTAADLAGVLQGDGPFTVFAPTNEAFAALPEGTVEMLLEPENKDKLVAVLTYHVVPGKVMAADVVKLSEAETVQGDTVAISTMGGKVMIDNANVISADIEASNGVVHVIDTVIMPGV